MDGYGFKAYGKALWDLMPLSKAKLAQRAEGIEKTMRDKSREEVRKRITEGASQRKITERIVAHVCKTIEDKSKRMGAIVAQVQAVCKCSNTNAQALASEFYV